MNSSVGKSIITERNNVISKNKQVDVTQLPDIKQEIQLSANESLKNKMRKK